MHRRELLIESHARELASMGDDWSVYLMKHVEFGGKRLGFELTGAVAPLLKSGEWKGTPNYRQKDLSTVKTLQITYAAHEVWCRAWEEKTGKCSRCQGDGVLPKSASVVDGKTIKTTRPCSACNGSGVPVVKVEREKSETGSEVMA